MWRTVGRAFWWVLAYERPTWWGDYAALAALAGLLALGAVALSWPWLVVEVPRGLVAGLAVIQATVAGWIEWLRSALPRIG